MDVKEFLVLDLKPTQFAIGHREVEAKIHKLLSLEKEDEFKDFLKEHPIPVVEYKGVKHITDHHHLARAVWEIGKHHVYITIEKDLSSLSKKHFWDKMGELKWVHLFDQFGEGPRHPELLPLDIRGMADDMFRSMAWVVRELGGYHKVDAPFSEFSWANFFRDKIPVGIKFDDAVEIALKLAHSKEASHLPGWTETSSILSQKLFV